jgi:hypothetical protein
MVTHDQRAPQQFARSTIGHAQQNLLARLACGLNDAEDSKITVPDE